MKKNWYAVITADILYNKSLSARQKLLVAVISNMSNDKGYCFASNEHLAKMMDCTTRTIQSDLSVLESMSAINRVMLLNGNGDVKTRGIYPMDLGVKQISPPHEADFTQGGEADFTHNNKGLKNKENRGRAPELSRQEYEGLVMKTGLPLNTVKEKTEVALLSYRGDRGKLPARPFDYVLSWILRDKQRAKPGYDEPRPKRKSERKLN